MPLRIIAGLLVTLGIVAGSPIGAQPQENLRRIYVPLEELDVIVERDKQGIVLSRDEYSKLTELAKKQGENFPPSTYAIVLSVADYAAETAGDQLVLTARLQFEQLKPGWQSITLPYRNLAVEGATLDDQPARLGRGGPGRALVLFSSKPGRHTLVLKLSTGLASVGSDRVAGLGLAPVPAATLTLSLPAGQFLHVNDVALERGTAADEPARYTVAIGGRNDLSLRITGRRAQEQAATLLFASTAIGLHVAPEERTWRAATLLNVFGKPIDALQFVIPRALDIVSVESTGLERWEIDDGPTESTTMLKLAYGQPFAETRAVTFQGLGSSVIGEPWSVPTLGLVGATSHLVRVLVQHPAGLRLQPVEATGIRRITAEEAAAGDVSAMPDMTVRVDAGQMLHFAAWRDDFTLMFVTQPRARELQATIATRVDIDSRELSLLSSIAVQSRLAPLFELDLALPVDWVVVDVLHGSQPARWRVVPVDAASNRVQVSFQPPIPIDGRADFTLISRRIPTENWPIEEQPLELPLPEVHMPEVGVTDGRYMLAADDDLELAVDDLTGLDPVRLSEQELRLARAPRLAYEYQDTRFGGTLVITRKPLRLAARTLAFHRLDRETLISHLEARLVVEGGGLRKLELALPEATGTDLRFRLVDLSRRGGAAPLSIIEQTSVPPALGERVWTLRFDQRAFGLLWLVVDLQSPRGADAREFRLPALRVVGAGRQSGQVAVEGGPDQQLSIEAVDAARQPLSEVDPADVAAPAGYSVRERIVAAYQAVRPGYALTVKETRFERQAVPTAICDAARLMTVVGEAGELQHKAEFDLRATGVQSLRVELPSGAGLWATLVDGRPIEVRVSPAAAGEPAAYLVPLPPAAAPAAPRRLELFYRTESARTDSGMLRQTPPRLAVVSGEGQTQALEILSREWTLHHPGSTDIIASTGQFEPTETPARSSLLGWLQSSLRLDAPRDLALKGLFAILAAAVIGVLWLTGRRRGKAGVVSVAALGLILLVIAVVVVPGMQMGIESAGVYETNSKGTDLRYDASAVLYSEAAGDALKRQMPAGGSGGAPGHGIQDLVLGDKDAPVDSAATAYTHSVGGALGGDMPARRPMTGEAIRDGRSYSYVRGSEDASGPFLGFQTKSAGAQALAAGTGVAGMPAEGQPGLGASGFGRRPENNTFLAGDLPEGAAGGRDIAQRAGGPFAAPAIAWQGQAAGGGGAANAGGAAGSAGRATGALLSLAVSLQTEPGSRQTTFHYAGAPAPGAEPTLEVEHRNRNSLSMTGLAWQTGVLLMFWFARCWSVGGRSAVAVLGLAGPLALAPLVPLELLPHLDGIFVGSIWGIALWAALGLIRHFSRIRPALTGDFSSIGRPNALLLLASLLAGMSGIASAQNIPNAPVNAPAAATDPKSEIRNPKSPPLIVPFDLADEPLKSSRVFLPFEQFLELWNAAHPEAQADVGAPRDGVVAEASYAAEFVPAVAGTRPSVAVAARIVLHSFRSEQITLGLPLGPVAVSMATLDGKPAPLVTREVDGRRELAVVVADRGAHVLDLRFSAPADQTGPSGSFVLPLRAVPSGTLRFVLPVADQTLRVGGVSGAFRRLRDGDKTIAVVPIDRGGDVSLAWAPVQARDAVDGIVHVDSKTALRFDDAGLRLQAGFDFTVRQGTLSEIAFALPPGLLVRQIAGLDLGGWEIAGEGDERSLKVFLRRPVTDATTLEFDLFQPEAFTDQSQPIAVPQFAPRSMTRETGTVGVFAEKQLAVAPGAMTGLVQIDAAQFQPPAASRGGAASPGAQPASAPPPQWAYRFAARPFALQLLVSRQRPVSRGIAEHAGYVGSRKLRLVSRIELQLVGAPRSELAVQLPAGYLLNDLKSHAVADYHVEAAAEGQPPVLRVDLAAPRTGTVELILDGIVPRGLEDRRAIAAVPTPLGVGELRSALAVWLDGSYSATLRSFEGWKSVDPDSLPTRLRGARQAPVQLAFTSTLTAVQPVVLDLARSTARLSGEALSVVMVRETSVQYSFYLRWRIGLAGEDTFVFTTPDWLAGTLEIERRLPGVRIRQVSSEKIPGNRLRWTVTLEDPRESVLLLSAEAILPPPDDSRILAPQLGFERSVGEGIARQFQPLENQRQFLLLVNQSPLRLDRDSPEGAVEAIGAADVPIRIGPEIGNQAAEILAVRDPAAAISWRAQPAARVGALPASVNVARMTLVVARDGSWRGLAQYRINNRARQFLALRMPAGSRVLSLFVANQAARPIDPGRAADPQVLLVPLPKTAAGDLSAEVRLVLAGRFDRPLPRGLQILRTELDLPAPQILSQVEDPEFGAPVAATEWTVILPQDMDVRRVDDPDRSNVATSAEGAESTIALYREILELSKVASDSSKGSASKARALSNLKQLGSALHSYEEMASAFPPQSERQARELTELRQKVQAANELQVLDDSIGMKQAESRPVSGYEFQQRILGSNSTDFAIESRSAESEELKVELAPPAPKAPEAAEKSAAKPTSQAAANRNRTVLRSETASQSLGLNTAVAARQLEQGMPAEAEDKKSFARPQMFGVAPPAQQPDRDLDGAAEFDRFWSDERYSKAPVLGPVDGEIAERIAGQLGGMRPGRGGGGFGGGVAAGGILMGKDDAVAWTSPGGLSLDIAIPEIGQKLTFSKPGGDAKLALGLRPRASLETGLGLAWTLLWLVIGLGLIAALGRADIAIVLRRRLPWGFTLVGIAWYFLLPLAALGFVLFVAGLVALAWQHRKPA